MTYLLKGSAKGIEMLGKEMPLDKLAVAELLGAFETLIFGPALVGLDVRERRTGELAVRWSVGVYTRVRGTNSSKLFPPYSLASTVSRETSSASFPSSLLIHSASSPSQPGPALRKQGRTVLALLLLGIDGSTKMQAAVRAQLLCILRRECAVEAGVEDDAQVADVEIEDPFRRLRVSALARAEGKRTLVPALKDSMRRLPRLSASSSSSVDTSRLTRVRSCSILSGWLTSPGATLMGSRMRRIFLMALYLIVSSCATSAPPVIDKYSPRTLATPGERRWRPRSTRSG